MSEQNEQAQVPQQQPQLLESSDILSEEEFKRIEEEEQEEVITEEDSDNLDEEEETDGEESDNLDEEDREDIHEDVGHEDKRESRGSLNTDINNSNSDNVTGDKVKPADYLKEINQERHIGRKKAATAFIIEYSKGPYRSHQTVSDKLRISRRTGYDYLKEFISVIKEAVEISRYPDYVLEYYNDPSIEDAKRLKFHHLDHLKEVILKYSNYDVTKRLNTGNSDNYQSNKQVASTVDDLSILDNLQPSSTQKQEPVSNSDNNEFHDVYRLEYGITPYQLLRFGLLSVYDQAIRNRASQMIGPDPSEYFMSEKKMKDLLMMLNQNQHQADRFIEWLKNAAKYVAHPIGFLQNPFSTHPLMMNGNSGQQQGQQQANPMDEYYYLSGIYIKNLPPDHPANQQRLSEHMEREREEKEAKAMDRQFGKMFKLKMMDFLGGGQGASSGPFGGGNSLFSPEMMLLTGNAEMKQTTDEQGRPTGWTIVPKFGVGGQQQNQQNQQTQSPVEQMNIMMQTMRSMMEMMNGMQKQNSDPLQQNFTSQIMQVLMNRAFESPTNKLDELVQMTTLMDKIKGPASSPLNGVTNPYATAPPEILKELKQMELDKEFVQMRMQFEREKLQSDQQRAIQQDREAAENTDKIIQAITGIAPTAMAFLQQFMNGNKQQQGQPVMGQGQPPGAIDPQEAALRLHFQQQKMAEEERRRRIEEQNRIYTQPQPQPQYVPVQPQPQPQPESTRVIIQERPVYRQQQEEEEEDEEPKEYSETDFMPYDIDKLQENLRKAQEKQQQLENYKAAISSAINNKMLLGDSKPQPQPQPVQREQQEVVEEEEAVEQVDIGEILDKAKEQYDPDYDAVAEDRSEQEEEIEEVDIPEEETEEG